MESEVVIQDSNYFTTLLLGSYLSLTATTTMRHDRVRGVMARSLQCSCHKGNSRVAHIVLSQPAPRLNSLPNVMVTWIHMIFVFPRLPPPTLFLLMSCAWFLLELKARQPVDRRFNVVTGLCNAHCKTVEATICCLNAKYPEGRMRLPERKN